MPERVHDDEPDTGETTVRALLERQCPDWAGRPVTYLATSGTDNAMWRVHDPRGDVVMRLPRRPGAAQNIDVEVAVLQQLVDSPLTTVMRTPRVRHVGLADPDVFPFGWAILEWLEGDDAWTVRDTLGDDEERLACDVAHAVHAIAALEDMPVSRRRPGDRGGPIGPVLDGIEAWLTEPRWNAAAMIDVAAVRRVVAEAVEMSGGDGPIAEVFVHGDLIPGNLLVSGGRLTAVIDWGSAGIADPAQDLAPAWSLFGARGRQVFGDAVGADEPTWQRARLFEVLHAVGGVLYYVPRGHPLGDVMSRTLHRLVTGE
ncbi:phosphotransferase [Desertimonas flava]|uniref:phosphotransferase n=1 Tax=Desertimonas flava TaxID=2064846 RepID=UPI000E34A833|nr:phosphotransferase [Desertimonas flava]